MSRYNDTIARVQRMAMEGMVGVDPLPARDEAAARAARANATIAQAVGASLEHWLGQQHRAAATLGLAHVRHVGPPVAHSGSRGQHLKIIGVGPADYQGVLRGGRALAVEAKSRDGRLSRADIPEHQQRDLQRVSDLGGLALLVVEVRGAQLLAAVPWAEVPWTVRERRVKRAGDAEPRVERSETVGAEELAPWRALAGCYLRRWA